MSYGPVGSQHDPVHTDPPGQGKKVKWSECEDKILSACVKQYGPNNWAAIATSLPGRTGKQCRERWTNQLDPCLTREIWTPQEDLLLLTQQKTLGNSWAKIASQLPGRSSNAVKNRWCWLIRHQVAALEERAPAKEDGANAAIPASTPTRTETWELPGLNELAQAAHPEIQFEKADGVWIDQSESFWI
jgi:hypothetical protein